MFIQFRKQNWIIITILLVLLISSTVITIIFANKIYSDFKSILLEKEDTILRIYSQNLNHNLDDISRDLLLVSNLSCIKNYINNGFESDNLKNQAIYSFEEFLNSNKNYTQIEIKNITGDEKIILNNKNLEFLSIPDNNSPDFFQKTLRLKKNEINIEIINLKIKKVSETSVELPILKVSTPLFDLNSNVTGVFTISINLNDIIKIFPKNFFIQTNDGYIEEFQKNGELIFKKSYYDFDSANGLYKISSSTEIHYQKIEYLNKDLFIIGSYHDHSEMTQTVHFIIAISIIMSLLIFLSFFITFAILYKRFKNIMSANKTIIYSLAKLAESRDEVTGKHLEKVSKYSIILSKGLINNKKFRKILSKEYIEDLEIAVQLHDIGKVGIKDSILLKNGKLNEKEYDEIKEHVSIGISIIEDIISKINTKLSFFELGKNIIKYHHEKFDGTGYPFNLSGEDIPLEARIFSLVDAYDAITSKRPYKEAFSHEEAVDRILKDKGKHFDPEIVDAFIDVNQEFKILIM